MSDKLAKWNRRFLRLAGEISGWSKDPSTKVGCVIVGPDREIRSTGYNGFPRGVEDAVTKLSDRNQKYPLICHAEENAIMNAARVGVPLSGCCAYVTMFPCSRCTRSLIQAGVTSVVCWKLDIPERWRDDMDVSLGMFNEIGMELVEIEP